MVLPSLAAKVGLHESIILQQVHFWLNIKRTSADRYRDYWRAGADGTPRWWVASTLTGWGRRFYFLSDSTIRRALASLVDQGLLYAEQLADDTRDKTLWYSINYERLEALLTPGSDNEPSPTPQEDITPPDAPIEPSVESHRPSVEIDRPSSQNEHMACPEWSDASAQNGQMSRARKSSGLKKESLKREEDGAEAPISSEEVPPKEKTRRFVVPTVEEVEAECLARGYSSTHARAFWFYYDSKGWIVGKGKMQKWRSSLSGWLIDKTPDAPAPLSAPPSPTAPRYKAPVPNLPPLPPGSPFARVPARIRAESQESANGN